MPALDREARANDILGIQEAPEDIADLPRGSVPYLPCGVDEILAMVSEAPLSPEDVFVDLGSGLGRVAILAHLLSGARAIGLEIQEPLVHRATASVAALGLDDVSFVHESATDVELDGSVFFMYAPFNGAMLRCVVRRLEDVSKKQRIVVCAVGLELRDVPWLVARTSSMVSLMFYDSRAPRYMLVTTNE